MKQSLACLSLALLFISVIKAPLSYFPLGCRVMHRDIKPQVCQEWGVQRCKPGKGPRSWGGFGGSQGIVWLAVHSGFGGGPAHT